jgi:phospholipid/cholesterol/gamma-HCH transport system ATP-binding protein
MTPLIEFKQVSKAFDSNVVLNRADLSIYPGQVTTVIGKSGVGKSVTLKLIIGLLAQDDGEIMYRGRSISSMSRQERKKMRSEVNFMFQNNALFDSLNVHDNIALPLQEKTRLSKVEITRKVGEKMEALDLQGIEDKFPSQISGGMQKRVALARALVTDPQVVLFDEPTTGLDPVRKNSVLTMITQNQRNFGFTAVLVSHDVPDVFYISNRIAILEDGEVLFQGRPDQLEQLSHPVIHDFINSLETLKNDVIGLKTRRDMERNYAQSVHEWGQDIAHSAVVLTISGFERVKERVGHLVAHNIVNLVTRLVDDYSAGHLYECGRYSQDRIVCLFPKNGADMAKKLIEHLRKNMKQDMFDTESGYTSSCVTFSIEAGMVSGELPGELNLLVDRALQNNQVVSEFVCGELSREV